MTTLPIDLKSFPFYSREQKGGKNVTNRCGRDFLYYGLAYLKSDLFSDAIRTPLDIERSGVFGLSVPSWLAWTQVQFVRMPAYLQSQDIRLSINGRPIVSFGAFFRAILFSRQSVDTAITDLERAIRNGTAAGIDISIGFGGLLDHVMFVYGFDDENLYVFETTSAPINYMPASAEFPKLMRLPKEEVRKRWTMFGRVWLMENKQETAA